MSDITILSIDDDQSICFALSAIVKSQGWNSVTADNVDDGIEIVKKMNITLILLDYRMPKKNGLVGIKEIREINKTIPIIVLTIDNDQKIADKFLKLGATDFAVKPIKAPDLISRINLHLKLLENKKYLNLRSNKKYIDNIIRELYPLEKGINKNTLERILNIFLNNYNKDMTAEDIVKSSGLSIQSTYRYLQFLETNNIVYIKNVFGKVGRPKQFYKLK